MSRCWFAPIGTSHWVTQSLQSKVIPRCSLVSAEKSTLSELLLCERNALHSGTSCICCITSFQTITNNHTRDSSHLSLISSSYWESLRLYLLQKIDAFLPFVPIIGSLGFFASHQIHLHLQHHVFLLSHTVSCSSWSFHSNLCSNARILMTAAKIASTMNITAIVIPAGLLKPP